MLDSGGAVLQGRNNQEKRENLSSGAEKMVKGFWVSPPSLSHSFAPVTLLENGEIRRVAVSRVEYSERESNHSPASLYGMSAEKPCATFY